MLYAFGGELRTAIFIEKDKNQKWSYTKLIQSEAAIFGGVNPAVRSKVTLRIINQNLTKPKKFQELSNKSEKNIFVNDKKVPAIKYAAFGLYNLRDQTQDRQYIEGSWDLLCEYEENIETELQIAFSMLNLFGTLGSKARNGYGSVQISSKDFRLLSELEIKEYLKNKKSQLVPYTAFNEIKIVETGIKNSADEALKALESIRKKYSSHKPNFKVQRYPKRYWFSVKRTDDGKYKWQGLYLPVLIEKTPPKDK